MQRIAPLDDAQVVAWEEKLEAQMVQSLQSVMDQIAARIAKIQVASAWLDAARIEVDIPLRALIAAVTTGPDGDDLPPPMTAELAIPDPPITPVAIPETPALPPGAPYISPDDLASIAPLWQQQVVEQILPLVAQVFIDSAGNIRSQLLESVAPNVTVAMPRLGSIAAEQYLATARNSFDEIGDHLWETARAQMSQGFEAGESIPQIADRLRQSAGLTARQGVLVARTSVIEASNSGSLQMAQVSGLQMQKEWISTLGDGRTRPSHLAADGQRVDLNEPFVLITGNSGMFPADPSFPPADRYRCRCTIGYVMPDRPKEIEPPLSPRLDELPGTSGMPEIEAPVLPVAPDVAIRSALVNAGTLREVDAAAMTEARRLTGRDIRFDQTGSDVQIAREHAEGILRGLERYPESPISQVGTFGPGSSAEAITRRLGVPDFDEPRAFTATLPGNDVVLFNARMAGDPEAYAEALARGHGAGWHAQGTATPMGQALHEFGHTVDETFTEAGAKVGAVRSQMTVPFTGKAYKEAVRTEVSRYAATSTHELGGEAFADVMINGERASATSRAVFDAIERGYVKVHPRVGGEVLPKESGPGFDLPARGEHPPTYVRPSLTAAKTPRELRRVWQDEVQAITGFPFVVDAMPHGISLVTAREYAEGTLQMFAQFPGARVDRIHWFDDAASSSYAQVRRGGHAIEFNMRYASEKGRPKFLAARRKDAAGWDTGSTSWGVRNDMSGQGVVYHEFTHILDIENGREAIHGSIVPLLIQHAQREGITDIDDMIKRQISSYATKNYQEMIAEAGADVMTNGAAASALSRDIFDLLRAEYRRRGFEIRTAPSLSEDIGEAFPKAAAPRALSSQTVAQLRALAKERGITVPRGTRKADLVRMLEEAPEPRIAPSIFDNPDLATDPLSRDIIESLTVHGMTPAEIVAEMPELGAQAQGYVDEIVALLRHRGQLPPAPVVPLSRAPLAYQARQAELREAAARPTLPDKSRRLSGESAYTTRVEHEGGPPTVTKDYTRQNETLAQGKRSADAEELGALVDDAVGLRAPTVIRTGPRSIEESFLEGQSGEEILPWPHTVTDELIGSDDGRLIGLSDILVGESDRNAGNFIRLADGRLASIDRGGAFQTPKLAGARSPFAEIFAPEGKWAKTIDIAPQDLAVIRARLEALRSEFERLGRATWHKQVMARLTEVEKRADPAAAIRLAEARPDLATVKAQTRAAARAQAATIATQRGNAALIARVDELVQAKASKAVIRQELEPALRQAEQLYAGADDAVADALRAAVDSGDAAKIRAALTRQSRASGLTPIGKAGAKAKFDPDTMEGVGGTVIPDGADVIVVRRGAKLAGIETPEKAVVRLARAPSSEKTVAKGDFSGMTRVSEPLGGNPGGIFEAGDGSRWYVKAAAGEKQARSEALALDLYRAAGLDAPELVIGEGVEGLGTRQVATRFLDDAQVDLRARLADDPAYIAEVQDGFAVDAWLANWDVVGANPAAGKGWDNIVSVAGRPVRIEAGGALRYRGLGGDKPFGDDVIEMDTLRSRGRAKEVFGDMTPEQIIASAERVRKVTPAKIKALVKKHGLDSELADTLIARRADILRRADLLAGPKPLTPREYAAKIKAAAKKQEALDAVPYSTTDRKFGPLYEPDAVDRYRGAANVNEEIRDAHEFGLPPSAQYRADIRDIDRVFDESRLTADVELWRAPGSGRGIFGDPDTWGDDLAGFEWSDPAYSSTSASKTVADRFTKDGGVRLRVLASKDSKAIQLSDMPAPGIGVSYTDEAEILLARGARYRVVKDRGWTEITHPTTHQKIRVRDLDVEVTVPDETPPLPWETK